MTFMARTRRCNAARQASFVISSLLSLLLISASLCGQDSQPPLEPIPMPAPLAKSDKSPAEDELQAEQIPTDAGPAPTELKLRPASNLEPRPADGPNFSNDEVIVESTVMEPQAIVGEPQPTDQPFTLDTGGEVVIEGPAYTPPPIENTNGPVVVPSAPRTRVVPADPNIVVSPSGPIVTRRSTTIRSYYMTPSGRVYLPQQSTSTYQQTYYAPRVEYPAGGQVTVYRNPYSRVTAISVMPPGPPPSPFGYGYGPGPFAPVGFNLVVDPGLGPIAPPPPMVPGQPVRNAIRALAW